VSINFRAICRAKWGRVDKDKCDREGAKSAKKDAKKKEIQQRPFHSALAFFLFAPSRSYFRTGANYHVIIRDKSIINFNAEAVQQLIKLIE
jgi:hypothetical protein